MRNFLVGETFIIDALLDVSFATSSGRGTFALLGGAKIEIGGIPNVDFNFLHLTNVDVFGCPTEDLAEGIIIYEIPNQLFFDNLILDNCTVANCRIGVNAKRNARISISNTTFMDNYIGLNLDMSSGTSSQKNVTFTSFANNTFRTVGGLRPKHANMPENVEQRGFCGIQLIDYHDFNIGQTTTFMALANGLVAERSEMNIGAMNFKDIKSTVGAGTYPFEGRGISMVSPNNSNWANINPYSWETMTFDDCKTGIYASGMAGKTQNCNMTKVTIGIDWQKSRQRDIFIKKNNISARNAGVRSFGNEPLYLTSSIENNTITIDDPGSSILPSAGIRATESNGGTWGWLMQSNTISMKKGGVGIDYKNGTGGAMMGNTITSQSQQQNYTGIRADGCQFTTLTNNTITQSIAGGTDLGASQGIRSSGGVANTYNCNCLDNTNTGIQFYDLSNFTNSVQGNNFNTHVTGMQLGDPSWTASYIGTQFHRGNKWDLSSASGTNGDFGAVNYNQGGLFASRFWVDGMENSSFSPAVDPDAEWFVPDPLASPSYACGSACSFPPGFAGGGGEREETEITELDGFVLNGSIVGSTEQLWKSRYQLYRRILRQPTLANNDQYSNWLSTQQHTSVGELATMAEMRLHIYDLDAADQTQAEVYRNGLSVLSSQIATADSTRLEGTTIDANQYNTLYQSKTLLATQSEQFWATIRANQNATVLDLIERNATIATTGISDANHKTVNHILLSMATDQSISKEDISMLDAIAQQCPSEAGDAVYEARAVAGHYLDKQYGDDACASLERKGQPSSTNMTDQLKIYPNPANDILYWQQSGAEINEVLLYNTLGQRVAQANGQTNMLHIGNLPNGTYYIQFWSGDGVLVANKPFVIFNQ